MTDMATDIAKGVEQVSVGKAEMSIASRAARANMCANIASVPVIAVSLLAYSVNCFSASGFVSIHKDQVYTVTGVMCSLPINNSALKNGGEWEG